MNSLVDDVRRRRRLTVSGYTATAVLSSLIGSAGISIAFTYVTACMALALAGLTWAARSNAKLLPRLPASPPAAGPRPG